jgi:biotin carboxylase
MSNPVRKARVLVMPAGQFQVPAIREARDAGLEVVAMDNDPAAPGLAIADFPEAVNPLDVKQAIDIARRYHVEGVVTVASDPCLIPGAEVCRALGLPGIDPEAARLTRNKFHARQRLHAVLPQFCPRFHALQSEDDAQEVPAVCGLPAVLKPVQSSGSKGAVIVRREEELLAAFRYAQRYSTSGVVLAEEQLTGPEVSIEGVVAGGTAHIVAITDKTTTDPPYCVEIAHSVPTSLPQDVRDALRDAVEAITQAFGLDACALHVEMFMQPDGPKLVEYGARLGGGCIASHLVPLATGTNLIRAAIALAMGDAPRLDPTLSRGAAIRFLTPVPGLVTAISGLEEARSLLGVEEVVCALTPGSIVHPLENSDHRVGHVIATGFDSTVARAAAIEGAARICIETSLQPG